MDDKWGGHKPAAMRLAPAESGAGAGPLPARCWHGGGSDGSAGAGPLHSQFALSPPVRCRLRRGWPQLPEPARWWAASAMLSGKNHNYGATQLIMKLRRHFNHGAPYNMYIMELHHVDDGSPQIVQSSITVNCRAPWIEWWIMDLHKSNDMELHNSNNESP